MSDDDDGPLEWIEFPDDEEATVLTSISPQCLDEDCTRCPGMFRHPDGGEAPVFCVHVCHRVSRTS